MATNLLTKLDEILESNYSDPSFGVEELARALGISRSNLLKKLRAVRDKSITQYICEYRLNKALEILQSDDKTVSEVASKCGFRSAAYFNTSFKKQFGYPPGEIHNRKNGQSSVQTQHIASHEGNSPAEAQHIASHEGNSPAEAQHIASHDGNSPVDTQNIASDDGNSPIFRKSIISGLIIIILTTSAFIFLKATGRIVKQKSIAVIPLRTNTPGLENDQQVEFIWEGIISTLNQIQVFDIRPASSSGLFRDTTGFSIPQIGRKLKVKYLIEGSVAREGDSLKLWIQMIKAKEDFHFGADEYYIPIGGNERNAKMLEMAEHIAYQLNTKISPDEQSSILIRCSKSTESIQNYLIGNSHMDFSKGIEPEIAVDYYRKAIELDSSWPSPYFKLAQCCRILFENYPNEEYVEERQMALKNGHEIRPGPWSFTSLLGYYLDVGDMKSARKWFRKTNRKYPDNQFYLGKAARNIGNWKIAEEMLLNLFRKYPDEIQINYTVAETNELQRDYPTAIKHFNIITSIQPQFSLPYYNLADIKLKWDGDIEEARKILEGAFKQKQWTGVNAMQASYMLTVLDIFEGKYQEALDELSNWTYPATLGRGIPPYYYRPKQFMTAEVYGYLGDKDLEKAYYDSTIIYIENISNEVPTLGKRPGVLSCLGMAYAGLGEKEKAHEIANMVEKTLSHDYEAFHHPFAMEDVAWIYTKTGEYNKALKTIRKLLSKPGPLTAKLLEIDPKWDIIRNQPGFQELIDKYSIEVVEVAPDTTTLVKAKLEKPDIDSPFFVDERDGNTYHYSQIGTQIWMIENLAWLPEVSPPDSLSYTKNHYYVYDYPGTKAEEAKATYHYKTYGVLYNWAAAITACPEGWHLPSNEEWNTLEKHFGLKEEEVALWNERKSGSVGKKLKYTSGWNNHGNGDNSAGFYTLPCGILFTNHTFDNVNKNTAWWLSSSVNDSEAMIRAIAFQSDATWRHSFDKQAGMSVRCIKD